jgi:hypothetical protein
VVAFVASGVGGGKVSAIVEKFYAPWELVVLLGFTDRHWINKAKAGAAGDLPGATFIDGEWRIPASDVVRLIEAGKVKRFEAEELGVSARSEGELRRKVGLRRGKVVPGGSDFSGQ